MRTLCALIAYIYVITVYQINEIYLDFELKKQNKYETFKIKSPH